MSYPNINCTFCKKLTKIKHFNLINTELYVHMHCLSCKRMFDFIMVNDNIIFYYLPFPNKEKIFYLASSFESSYTRITHINDTVLQINNFMPLNINDINNSALRITNKLTKLLPFS